MKDEKSYVATQASEHDPRKEAKREPFIKYDPRHGVPVIRQEKSYIEYDSRYETAIQAAERIAKDKCEPEIQFRPKYVALHRASAKDAAEKWKECYCRNGKWTVRPTLRPVSGSQPEDIYNILLDLGTDPDISEVARIVGNKSWSYITCCGCGEHVEVAVQIGPDSYNGFCETCILEAAQLLREEKKI